MGASKSNGLMEQLWITVGSALNEGISSITGAQVYTSVAEGTSFGVLRKKTYPRAKARLGK